MKKRLITSIIITILAMSLLPITAFAQGHNGKRSSSSDTTYQACQTEGCNATSVHNHGSTYYSGHSFNDGHDYHLVCSINDCTITTAHDHNGITCFPHNNTDGHSCHTSRCKGKGTHH